MNFLHLLSKSSIKIKATLTVLLIFIPSLWSLSLYSSLVLREDMEHLLGEQQRSTVTLVAKEINAELQERFEMLEKLAAAAGPYLSKSPDALQAFLDQSWMMELEFNAGLVAVGTNGVAIAELPRSMGRVGLDLMDREHIIGALKGGKTTLGKPVMGRKLQAALIIVATPIRDAQGQVIGALSGLTDLGKANFLDEFMASRYSRTGGYLLVDTKSRLVITATDKRRIMQALPAPGVNRLIDSRIAGFDDTSVTVNQVGVEVLSSAARVPAAAWFVVVSLPTEEAFAPIHAMQQRLLWATMLLTVLAGGLTWWMLRRQLAPMLATARTLAALADADQPPRSLPIVRQDEIGELVGGFNHLLAILAKREEALRESEYRFRAIFDASLVPMAINDDPGNITLLNQVFVQTLGYTLEDIPTLEDWWLRGYPAPQYRQQVASTWQKRLVDAELSGQPFVPMELNICCKDGSVRVFLASACALEDRFLGSHLVILYDITERKQAENERDELNRDFVAFLENTSDFIYFKDENSRFRFCSQTLADITGHASWRDMIGKHDMEVFPEDTARIYYEEELPIFRDAKPLLNKVDPYYDASGRPGWVSTNKWPLLNADGKVVGLFGISHDISERVKAEEKLRQAANVFTYAREGIMITDPDSTIVDVNAAFTRITGYTREEVLGAKPRVLSMWRQEGKAFYAMLQKELHEKGHWFGEIWDRRKSGEVYAEMLTISAVRDAEGKTLQYVVLLSDITERKEREDKMRRFAFYDPLTQLPNRRLFCDRLSQAMAAGKRSGCYGAMMFLDMDNFKPLNDLHGHAVGDLLLVSVAKRLRECVRELDTVARFGGDEFVVLLHELKPDKADSTEEACSVAEKIRASLAVPYFLTVTQPGQTDSIVEHHCSASIGVVVFLNNAIGQEELFQQADAAMYQAKEAGRNVVCVWKEPT
ncbi:MAG: PAS domain S-box protein [Rhodoferax sp.]|nr:PAS domain S-box protein [Rhodoferax sp.]